MIKSANECRSLHCAQHVIKIHHGKFQTCSIDIDRCENKRTENVFYHPRSAMDTVTCTPQINKPVALARHFSSFSIATFSMSKCKAWRKNAILWIQLKSISWLQYVCYLYKRGVMQIALITVVAVATKGKGDTRVCGAKKYINNKMRCHTHREGAGPCTINKGWEKCEWQHFSVNAPNWQSIDERAFTQ